jgi:squalene-associated FAD-dependent desaturase
VDRLAHLDPRLNPPVAVVGAGWAGLSAAVALCASGVPAVVYEASRHLGGRARRVTIDGLELDNGQHILLGAYAETLRMMRLVGCDTEEALLRLPLSLGYADGFRLRAPQLAYPLNLLFALLSARPLSWTERMSAVALLVRLRAVAFRIAPDRPVAVWLEEERQSPTLRRYLWEPLCLSALNTPVAHASAQVFAHVLRDALGPGRSSSDMLIPRVDLGRLFPDPAAQYISMHAGRVEPGTAIRSIERSESGFRLDAGVERFAAVIIATGPQHAAGLLPASPELDPARACIAALEYEPIITCYLQYAESVRLPQAMLGFTGPLLQWVFDRGLLGGQPGLLAAVISGSGPHDHLSREQIAQRCDEELRHALPGLPAPLWSRVITEKRATFSCRPGMSRPAVETAMPGLLLAGDYVAGDYPATIEAAVRSGIAAAEAAQGYLRGLKPMGETAPGPEAAASARSR